MSRIILWRHGNTDWNNDGRIQGQTDVPLNQRGHEQAAAAAERLARFKPDLIISSDLSRAWETAAKLATHTGLPVTREPRLRERHFGVWETLTIDEVKQRYPDSHARWVAGEASPGDGLESLTDLGKRVAEVVREVNERNPGGVTVLVTHGGAVRWGVAAVLGWSEDAALDLGGLGNCRWTELGHRPGPRGWQLLAHNVGA